MDSGYLEVKVREGQMEWHLTLPSFTHERYKKPGHFENCTGALPTNAESSDATTRRIPTGARGAPQGLDLTAIPSRRNPHSHHVG